MMIIIDTQDYENYAAHTGFDGSFYWKAKGGSTYKITNVPANADINQVVDMARAEIERNDEYFQTTIIDFSTASDNYLSEFEMSQLEYEGSITFKEPEIDYSELNNRYTDPMEYANAAADADAVYYGA